MPAMPSTYMRPGFPGRGRRTSAQVSGHQAPPAPPTGVPLPDARSPSPSARLIQDPSSREPSQALGRRRPADGSNGSQACHTLRSMLGGMEKRTQLASKHGRRVASPDAGEAPKNQAPGRRRSADGSTGSQVSSTLRSMLGAMENRTQSSASRHGSRAASPDSGEAPKNQMSPSVDIGLKTARSQSPMPPTTQASPGHVPRRRSAHADITGGGDNSLRSMLGKGRQPQSPPNQQQPQQQQRPDPRSLMRTASPEQPGLPTRPQALAPMRRHSDQSVFAAQSSGRSPSISTGAGVLTAANFVGWRKRAHLRSTAIGSEDSLESRTSTTIPPSPPAPTDPTPPSQPFPPGAASPKSRQQQQQLLWQRTNSLLGDESEFVATRSLQRPRTEENAQQSQSVRRRSTALDRWWYTLDQMKDGGHQQVLVGHQQVLAESAPPADQRSERAADRIKRALRTGWSRDQMLDDPTNSRELIALDLSHSIGRWKHGSGGCGGFANVAKTVLMNARNQELAEFNDSCVDALKAMLVSKCGSLDAAFRWMDFSSRGRVSRSQFHTAYKVLNLSQCAILKEWKPGKIFGFIDDKRTCEVGLERWRAFFNYEYDLVPETKTDGAKKRSSLFPGANMVSRLSSIADRVRSSRPWGSSAGGSGVESSGYGRRWLGGGPGGGLGSGAGFGSVDDGTGSRGSGSGSLHPRPGGFRQGNGGDRWQRAEDDSHVGAATDSREDGYEKAYLPNLKVVLEGVDVDMEGEEAAVQWSSLQRKIQRSMVANDMQKAEAEQLEEDIRKLDLKGIKALAYVLKAKCGSLNRAFKWLDFNNSNSFTSVQWETAMIIAHIDLEALTGLKPREIFAQMAGKDGRVSKKAWNTFFEDAKVDDDGEDVSEEAKQMAATFIVRARRRLKNSWSRGTGGSQRSVVMNKPWRPKGNGNGNGTDTGRRRSAGGSRPGTSLGDPRNAGSGPSGEDDPDKIGIDSTGSSSLSRSELQGFSNTKGDGNKSGDGENGASHRHASADSGLNQKSKAGTNNEPLPHALHIEFRTLSPDEGQNFGMPKRSERALVEADARKLNYWVDYYGQGLLVYRPGPISDQIKKDMNALLPGERLLLKDLPQVRWHYIRAQARQVDTLVFGAVFPANVAIVGGDMEIWCVAGTLSQWAEGIRRVFLKLAPGEVIDFPNSLTTPQHEVITDIASEFGYHWKYLKAGFQDFSKHEPVYCFLAVGNLKDWWAAVRSRLEKLEPGEEEVMGPGKHGLAPGRLPLLARGMMHGAAGHAGLTPLDTEDADGMPVVSVKRPELVVEEGGEGADEQLDLWDEDTVKQYVTDVFNHYASGKQCGQNIFLRRPDVTRFVQDSCRLRAKCVPQDFIEDVECVFDDTLELSVDMGSRYHHGLTIDYFQVFLSKSASIMGWSLVSLLRRLLMWFQT